MKRVGVPDIGRASGAGSQGEEEETHM